MIAMASTIAARQRRRGRVETLPSGALRVTVYAGVDPLSNRRMYLRETVPAGPRAAGEAEKVRTRLLNQVDEKRNPRTTATVNQLIDRWLEVIDIEASTKQGYVRKIGKHIRPVLGTMQVAKLDAEILESFYAQLRKCRDQWGPEVRPAPHVCRARVRRARRFALPATKPGRVPRMCAGVPPARLPRSGEREYSADSLDRQRRVGPGGPMGMDRRQPSAAGGAASAAAAGPTSAIGR
jgi:hypothetical protein